MAEKSAEDRFENLSKILENCGDDLLEKFIHEVIDVIVWNVPSISYSSYKEVWSVAEWSDAKSALEHLIRSYVVKSANREELLKELDSLAFNDSLQNAIASCSWPRREEIRSSLIQNTCQISHSHLKDFDCAVKFLIASDKLASLDEPIIALDLDVQKEDTSRHISLELNQTQLESLITSLEAANKVIQQLRE